MEKVFYYRDEVNAFLQDVARALNKDPAEVFFDLAGTAVLIVLITSMSLLIRMFKKRKRERVALNLFNSIIGKKSLSGRDRELLDFIVQNSRKAKHLLPGIITDNYYFSKYANPLIAKNICTYTELALFRSRLGLRHKVLPAVILSTADLLRGMALRITFSRSGRCRGVVRAVNDAGLVFRLDVLPQPGEKVQLEYARLAGYYQIFSTVVQSSKEQVIIGHSENISRVQKRAFPRKRVQMAVGIQYPGEADFTEARLMDLSGCGACIRNPGLVPVNNQQVIISFPHEAGVPLTVPGRVVRVDMGNAFFGVAFGSIRETLRDKIIGFTKG